MHRPADMANPTEKHRIRLSAPDLTLAVGHSRLRTHFCSADPLTGPVPYPTNYHQSRPKTSGFQSSKNHSAQPILATGSNYRPGGL